MHFDYEFTVCDTEEEVGDCRKAKLIKVQEQLLKTKLLLFKESENLIELFVISILKVQLSDGLKKLGLDNYRRKNKQNKRRKHNKKVLPR